MTRATGLSEQDLHHFLDAIDHGEDPDAVDGLPPRVIAELADLIDCDVLSFALFHADRRVRRLLQRVPDVPERPVDDEVFWSHYWEFAPLSYPDTSGDIRRVSKISDFYSARELHGKEMYCAHLEPAGTEHELMLCLPGGPGRTARLLFSRGRGQDFTERDRDLLTLLRPHLQRVHADVSRRREGGPRLTPRQWQLLRLMANGYTNRQMARRLGVAEATVRKHMENIYGRLEVSNRAAALIQAFPKATDS